MELIEEIGIKSTLFFVFTAIGAFISIKTYMNSVEQRKFENTYKTLDFLRLHIREKQIETFIILFKANNEIAGIEPNQFIFDDGTEQRVEDMFSEGGCGNGDIHNMVELFNLTSPMFKNLEIGIIWFEYGQIMSKIFQWTRYLEMKDDNAEQMYKDFNIFMKKYEKKMYNKPTKYYVYCE